MRDERRKLKLLYLMEIFKEHTDTAHGLTTPQIIAKMEAKGLSPERKSLYDDMKTLCDFGFIVEPLDNTRPPQYALKNRDFSLAELKYMIDSIQSSKFLSTAKTRELADKLKKQCSEHERIALDRQVIVSNRVKSTNQFIQKNIDIITKAIAGNLQIKFRYAYYDETKKKRYRKKADTDGFYFVSPFTLIYTDDNYYLLGYEGKMKHFRVDKMEKMEIALKEREGVEAYQAIDMTAYTNYTFSMYGGKKENVSIVFSNHIMDTILDRFGREVVVSRVDDRHSKIIVPVAVSPHFFSWVFSLGKTARIEGPENVINEMKEMLEKVKNMYD